MPELFRIVHSGHSRWVKCSAELRDYRDKEAAGDFKRAGIDCKPSSGEELEIPCPGERQLVFGAAALMDNEGESTERGWKLASGPCRSFNFTAPPHPNVLGQTIQRDKDLFYRMNRWGGTTADGVSGLADNDAALSNFDPDNDTEAEKEYAQDHGPGGDDRGVVRCAPPAGGGVPCKLERVKRKDTAEDHLKFDDLLGREDAPAGSAHASGWDIQYRYVNAAGWGYFEKGALSRLPLCIKATFACKPKKRYRLWFSGGSEDGGVVWPGSLWGDLNGGATSSDEPHMCGPTLDDVTTVPRSRCGCSAASQCECGQGSSISHRMPSGSAQRGREWPPSNAGSGLWQIAGLRGQLIRNGIPGDEARASGFFEGMQEPRTVDGGAGTAGRLVKL